MPETYFIQRNAYTCFLSLLCVSFFILTVKMPQLFRFSLNGLTFCVVFCVSPRDLAERAVDNSVDNSVSLCLVSLFFVEN